MDKCKCDKFFLNKGYHSNPHCKVLLKILEKDKNKENNNEN